MNTRTTPTPSATPTPHHVGLSACAMLGGSKLTPPAKHVPAVCFPFFLPSIYTFSTYSTELLEIQRFLNVWVDGGFNCPASSRPCPGRITPRPPHRPLAALRACDGPILTFGTRLGNPRHRTRDPLVESDRPGTSALGRCQRALKAPGASAHPGAGHSGGTAQRVAQRQHSYRTSRTRPSSDHIIGHRPGEGVREKVRNLIGYHPLQPHGGQHFPLLASFGF